MLATFLRLNPIAYMDYDGSLSASPVNQFPALNEYQGHAATFAHQLDDAMGHHSLLGATEEDRLTVFQTIRDMIGSAWRRYEEWRLVDPQELIIGGNFDGTLLWKRYEDDFDQLNQDICGQCQIATFARQVLRKGNLPLLRRLNRSGIVYSIDRDLTPVGRNDIRRGYAASERVLRPAHSRL